jgi:hypothetical protein
LCSREATPFIIDPLKRGHPLIIVPHKRGHPSYLVPLKRGQFVNTEGDYCIVIKLVSSSSSF